MHQKNFRMATISMKQLDMNDLYEIFDTYLDESLSTVDIFDCSFSCSEILKRLDPIAYRTYFNDWLDSEVTNGTFQEVDNQFYF